MRRLAVLIAVVLLSPLGAGLLRAQTAADLVAKVLSRQQTRGFVVRARLVTGEPGSERPAVVQVRTIGRRDGATTRLLCQALWPASLKGRAVYVQKDGPRAVSGFEFRPPDTVTDLAGDALSVPLFDTDLTLEDLAEEFWSWPGPVAAGSDKVNGKPCKVVELRPPAGVRTSYSLVTSCISPEQLLPLRIETYGKTGALVRRFVVTKAIRDDSGAWVPVKIQVETAGRTRVTTLEVSRGERNASVPLAEFSIEKLKSFAAR
jgi:hypothetical protein